MDSEILKNREKPQNSADKSGILDQESLDDSVFVSNEAIALVENAEGPESVEDDSVFDEKQKKYVHRSSNSNSTTQVASTVKALPSREMMVTQTVSAIEEELLRTQGEVRKLLKNKSSAPSLINDKVIRIRFLNGLRLKLMRAAKLTEDFIVGLWKQYVKKMN